MTWFRIDDQWARHDKIRQLSPMARLLWVVVGVETGARKSDGHVAGHQLRDGAYLAGVRGPSKLAQELVDVGLWHTAETASSCASCKRVPPPPADGFLFHDWSDWQFTKDEKNTPIAKQRANRKKALLRDRALCEAVRTRDRECCRYCGIRPNWLDRNSPTGATYDHVDPAGENTLANVVVACRRCNSIKKERTPTQAGMTLLPPPEPVAAGAA